MAFDMAISHTTREYRKTIKAEIGEGKDSTSKSKMGTGLTDGRALLGSLGLSWALLGSLGLSWGSLGFLGPRLGEAMDLFWCGRHS